MRVFAIQITHDSIPLITLLNDGVAPELEGGWSIFLFEIRDDGFRGVANIISWGRFVDLYGGFKDRGFNTHRNFEVHEISRGARKGRDGI